MNDNIRELAGQAFVLCKKIDDEGKVVVLTDQWNEIFAELVVKECINKIETHRIPIGNSAAGEMACEWTYDALKEIRDEIKQHFGVE